MSSQSYFKKIVTGVQIGMGLTKPSDLIATSVLKGSELPTVAESPATSPDQGAMSR